MDPFEPYRRQSPVHWHRASGAWLITRYDDVAAALLDPRLSSSTADVELEHLPGVDEDGRAELADFFGAWLSLTDGARHRRLRRALTPALAPARAARWQGAFGAMAEEVVQRAGTGGDLEHTFARPYAAAVVCALLGVRSDEADQVIDWCTQLVGLLATGGVSQSMNRTALEALRGLTALVPVIAARRHSAHGIEPLLSGLHGSTAGSDLPDELLVPLFAQLVAGGYDPLARSLTTFARAAPGNGGEVSPELVEEMLRLHGPFSLVPRIVAESMEVGGRHLEVGDRVMLALGSGNVDDTHFPTPYAVDPTRGASHLSFGRGRHRCPAAAFARVAIGVGLQTLASDGGAQSPDQSVENCPQPGRAT
jgi:cytochrome P450